MTLSIVACDPDTGHLGVAVHTGYLAVGQLVPWAEPGVGAVATQAITEASYGPGALGMLRAGNDPGRALDTLLGRDPLREARQVAVVDVGGRVAVHTGDRCIPESGHAVGDGVVALANMVEADDVWVTMLEAYESGSGNLAERLCGAITAGHRAGGDLRGSTSAAVLTVTGNVDDPPWSRLVDLRTDDHAEPVAELARLLRLSGMYDLLGKGINASYAGRHDDAIAALHTAVEHDLGNAQAGFWEAFAHLAAGEPDTAEALLYEAVGDDPRWRLLWERLRADAGEGPAESTGG
ncbi:MAG: DUF1028 domain-containing protein [Actinobacteria bacterium]|nr:DUF1028 domain-containing protein [Actinomycetota bacterium]